MQLEPQDPPRVFFDRWFSPRELWGYWLVHIVVGGTLLKTVFFRKLIRQGGLRGR
jgi:hypothetical protein